MRIRVWARAAALLCGVATCAAMAAEPMGRVIYVREHGNGVLAGQQLALGGHAIAHPVDGKAMLAQAGPQAGAQQFVVFSQQHAHVDGACRCPGSWPDCAPTAVAGAPRSFIR